MPEPHAARAELDGSGRVLYHAKDIWPHFISCCLVVTEKLIDEKPEEVRDLVRGIAESGEWAETHRLEAAKVVSPYFVQDEKLVKYVLTEPPDRDPGPLPHFGRAVERSVDSFLENAYNVDRKLLHERNRVARLRGAAYRDVRLYEAVRPARGSVFNSGSYLYFERGVIRGMYQAGRQAGAAWLAAGPCVDHLEEPALWAAIPGA